MLSCSESAEASSLCHASSIPPCVAEAFLVTALTADMPCRLQRVGQYLKCKSMSF